MIWGFLTVLMLGLALLFGAPFLDFLAPSEDIILTVFNPETEKLTILATGSETLWYQWQSWCYIVAFALILSLILAVIYHLVRILSDSALRKTKQTLVQKTKELEQFKHQDRESVRKEYANKKERLNHEANVIDEHLRTAMNINVESQERLKMVNHKIKRQQKETQSKLGQRDRLRDEKKLIAEYLERSHWTLSDGTKVTYNVLKKLAKEQ